jgi:hypothetical protein
LATAYAVVALGRMIRRGPDAAPGTGQLHQAVDWARASTARVVRRTPAEPVQPAESVSGPPSAEPA